MHLRKTYCVLESLLHQVRYYNYLILTLESFTNYNNYEHKGEILHTSKESQNEGSGLITEKVKWKSFNSKIKVLVCFVTSTANTRYFNIYKTFIILQVCLRDITKRRDSLLCMTMVTCSFFNSTDAFYVLNHFLRLRSWSGIVNCVLLWSLLIFTEACESAFHVRFRWYAFYEKIVPWENFKTTCRFIKAFAILKQIFPK